MGKGITLEILTRCLGALNPRDIETDCPSLSLCLSECPVRGLQGLESSRVEERRPRPSEMAQQLGLIAALAEDLSSLPSAHARWLTASSNSSSKGSSALFWPPSVPALVCVYPHTYMYKCICMILNKERGILKTGQGSLGAYLDKGALDDMQYLNRN